MSHDCRSNDPRKHAVPVHTALAARVAELVPTPLRVHITGETGTGKNHLAYIFRDDACRAGRPFVEINVANLPDGLFEAELFGCRRGAFTGAAGDREGVLERADGGVLFLNEVGELSQAGQAKILTVLDTGAYRRLGESLERRFTARLISATNRSLRDLVQAGEFRADLYYRLAQITIEVPPLRDRPSDILPLVRTFLTAASARLGRRLSLERRAVRLLLRHGWPGNVRELKDTVEALAFLTPDGRIRASQVREFVRNRDLPGLFPIDSMTALKEKVEDLEREEILRALIRSGGNKTAAARSLGLSVPGLRAKLRRFRIPW